MKWFLFCLLILFLLVVFPVRAEPVQEYTVTATRPSALNIDSGFASSQVITEDAIQVKQYRTIYEALKDIPGVDTFSSSTGQNATVFIRGEKSEQTLVLVDGIEYNDPTDPTRNADLGVLQMDNIERIEVLRGAGSVLYPGMGSVINIISKSGKEGKTTALLEGGSFGTVRGAVALQGVSASKLDYTFSLGALRTEGISAAVNGNEVDGTRNVHFSSNLRKSFGHGTDASLTVRFFDVKTDIDKVPSDTPNNRASQQNLLTRFAVSHIHAGWTPTIAVSLRTIDRDSVDDGSTPRAKFTSVGDIEKAEWLNEVYLAPNHFLTAGVTVERQHASSRSNFTGTQIAMDKAVSQSTGLLQYTFSNEEGFGTLAGARIDYHSSFLWQPMFRVSPHYNFAGSQTTLRSNVGTGFKAASLYQLYGEYGTDSLKAEKAFSADFGIERVVGNGISALTLTAFYNRLTDMVDFNFILNRYENIGKAWTGGIEFSQSTRFWDTIRLSSAYTYLETKDELTGLSLLRRPRHRVTNSLIFQAGSWEGAFTHLLVGERVDVDSASFLRKTAPAYNLFNLSGAFYPWDGTCFFLRVENLFNTKYQSIDGYGTPGLSVYGGIKQTL